ncbi:hypothetical protein B0A49_13088 [Cryomyces minteri]|uniref:non-specific serine/threonine protein kinase n=1 Tax=Cryomyces minteri TaxID=331657 RepID=A0A4U0VEA0_9PEZI|nr:hypothetical protein B0A49_13088 [Cryomyces minteri]
MTAVLRWAKNYIRRAPSPPICFRNTNYEVVGGAQKLEEEAFEDYQTGKYYPVRIGDVLASKHQVVGKLGFGVSSTVWLARDLILHRHVTLKVFTRDHQNDGEIEMYEHLMKGNPSHPGKRFVRTFLDSFTIPRAGGSHHCLVHTPLWGSLRDMIARNPYRDRFNEELLRETLYRLFQALDYLHTDRKIIHTDISANNILSEIRDESMLDSFVRQELEHPSPRKQIGESIIYASRLFQWPPRGEPILCDFGSAEKGDNENTRDAGPDKYRAPEVMLKMRWSYPVDIWNVGVMFFDDDGKWRGTVPVPTSRSLDQLEENLKGRRKELFVNFMTPMLQWVPENRKTAKELLDDPWLNDRIE